jgi:flotillin
MEFVNNTENLPFILTILGAIFTCLLTIGLIIAKLYVRSTKEIAFVRTGMGGEK